MQAARTRVMDAPAEAGKERAPEMLFMVIEDLRGRSRKDVYRRFRDRGRGLPDGLRFEASWVTADMTRCFQLMGTDDVTLLQRWVAEWCDLCEFEIVPVTSGAETAAALAAQL